ncbi:hypothetical protein RclHR1_26640002 [Rhizophagus clarus]|uniref:Uncharacterized protein n=1 Tax=Rhizophagus clarus TaxID=94130 RepID=A0A2Z6R5A3_9GLOM|nr:hypothetical protein RclHR1_26640002 [Rhizophagus clarus]
MSCIYCKRLLYPKKVHWKLYDFLFTYPLQQHVLGISLSFNPNINCIPKLRVPTYESCKRPSTRLSFSHLFPLLQEILSVPQHKRRYLSPVFLHCSLGRIPNSNPYLEYRTLTGTMNYSQKIRVHALYSRALRAFLESNEIPDNVNQNKYSPYDKPLRRAATWLSQNNLYLCSFTNIQYYQMGRLRC